MDMNSFNRENIEYNRIILIKIISTPTTDIYTYVDKLFRSSDLEISRREV